MPDEKKSRYTEAQAKAAKKYLKESVEDIRIRVPKGDKAKVQEHAASIGESMNSFAVQTIYEKIYTVTLPLDQSITFDEHIQPDLEDALMKYGGKYMTGYSKESGSDGSAALVLKFKNEYCMLDEIVQDFRSILEKHGVQILPDQKEKSTEEST